MEPMTAMNAVTPMKLRSPCGSFGAFRRRPGACGR
jgi:hypothetical protein